MGYANGESLRLFVAVRIPVGNQEELCQSKHRRLKAVGVYDNTDFKARVLLFSRCHFYPPTMSLLPL